MTTAACHPAKADHFLRRARTPPPTRTLAPPCPGPNP